MTVPARRVERLARCLSWVALAGMLVAPSACSPAPSDEGREAPAASAAAPPTTVRASAAKSVPSDASATPGRTTLNWTGCDISKKAYMNEAAAAYEEATGVEILVTGGGATRGIRATAGGQTELGGACRQCLPDQYPEEEGDAFLTHVGWDALVFFTHKDNPVDGLTMEQARGILRGEIVNWSELGGDDARILPAFRRQTVEGKLSGVGYMTRLMVFGDPDIDYTENAVFLRSSGPVEEFVEDTPGAFAVSGVSSASRRNVKLLALDGVPPDHVTISSGRYPLFRPLYLVTHGKPAGPAGDFVAWLTGPEGQAVITRCGTVNLAEGAGLVDRFAHWPAALKAD